MIDRNLNYGRELIFKLSRKALIENHNWNQGPLLAKVLDLGAGSGADLSIVKKLVPGCDLHGVEVFPKNIEMLNSLGVKSHPINLEKDPLPFDDLSLDLVIANQVLEHTKELFWIFHEVSRTLKVGGHFLIGVPNLASFHNRILLTAGYQPTSIQAASAHIRGFTKHDLLRFLRKTFPGGYSLTGFGGSNFYPFPPAVAQVLADLWPNGAVSIFFLLKKTGHYQGSFLKYPVEQQLETNYFLG